MTTTIRSYITHSLAIAALFSLVICTSSAQAGTVSFDDIVQTTQTPDDPDDLYGEPNTATPNKLIFPHPNSFAATATEAGGVDVTDGFLTFTVNVDDPALTWATGITLVESGSWSLIPTSNQAGVRGNGSIMITEVAGAPVAGPIYPILYAEDLDQSDTPPDSGNWVGGFPTQGFGDLKVTAFKVSLNNRLFALSESGFSFIDKKSITFTVDTEMVPEPSTALLGLLAFSGLGLIAGRRRG